MTDMRSAYERCVADLEMARMLYKRATSRQNTTAGEIQRVAVAAKRLEMKVAAVRLAQADYHLDALRARIDYLESRTARDRATRREAAELEWALGALPVNAATVERLEAELEQRKQELKALSESHLVSTDAAA